MPPKPKYVWETTLVIHRPTMRPTKALHGSRAAAMTAQPAWAKPLPASVSEDGLVETWRSAEATFTIAKREVIYTP